MRDWSLIKVRPKIELIEKVLQSDFEKFQNSTIRPICKFQNQLVLNFISFYIQSKNKNFNKQAPNDKLNFVDSLFTKDSGFKNLLKGFIIGLFTQEEFQFYALNTSELNKRIIQLIKTRFLSQFKH